MYQLLQHQVDTTVSFGRIEEAQQQRQLQLPDDRFEAIGPAPVCSIATMVDQTDNNLRVMPKRGCSFPNLPASLHSHPGARDKKTIHRATMLKTKPRSLYAARSTWKAKGQATRPYAEVVNSVAPYQQRYGLLAAKAPPSTPLRVVAAVPKDEDTSSISYSTTHRNKRKRVNRHRVSPYILKNGVISMHTESALPATTWCMIQDMITKAKSLGDITRITLTFFKEHETLQRLMNNGQTPVFPIKIPASEVYNMLGVGVIKRVRCGDAKGTKGGFFLYFGKVAAIQHLATIKSNVDEVMSDVSQRYYGTPSVEDVDIAVLKMCEDQSDAEKWPCLTTTTVSFLSFLFQQDSIDAVALPGMSCRLVEAKRNRDPEFSTETAQADVNRRVYDVVSVLASCNLILISVTSDAFELRVEMPDKFSPRKHVRFNYKIFQDSSCLKIADLSVNSLSAFLESEKLQVQPGPKRVRKPRTPKKTRRRSSKKKTLSMKSSVDSEDMEQGEPTAVEDIKQEEIPAAEPCVKEERMHHNLRIVIPHFNFYDGNAEREFELPVRNPVPVTSLKPTVDFQFKALRNPSPLASPESNPCKLEALFPPITSDAQGNQDWWNESLKELLFPDALPSDELLNWEMVMASKLAEEQADTWGSVTPERSTLQPNSVHSLLQELDLACHEDLLSSDDEEDDGISTNGYFC